MWSLLIVTAALVHGHPAEFKAAWQKAKTRADLWNRWSHGDVNDDAYLFEFFEVMTPQEKEELWKSFREEAGRLGRVLDRQEKEYQDLMRRARQMDQQRKAQRPLYQPKPPPPPDMK
jgi:hypothetical protein